MIVSIEQRLGKLIISYANEEGEISYSQFNVPVSHQYSYLYSKYKNKGLENVSSWDGKPVRKVPSQFLNKHRIQEFFIDAGEEYTAKLFKHFNLKLYSCDIEVDVTDDGFAEPENATNRINAIAWVRYPEIICFGIKPLSGDQCASIEKKINEHIKKSGKKYNFLYKYHKNEADMLYDFLYNYVRLAPLITGWFFWGYDWMYITERCNRLNMDISWVSPTKQWYQHKIKIQNRDVDILLPQHKLIVDYLEIYKKWDRTIEVKENNTLEFVAKEALGITKVKYPGTIQDLFIKDFEDYIFYNAIDAVLVELIHEKLKTMNTFLGLANITNVEAMQAFSPIRMLETVLTRYAYKNNKVFPKISQRKEREKYEGAFVYEPKPDLYPWVASFDFASLYPLTMIQFMISIDNFITKDKNFETNKNQIKCVNGAVFDASGNPLIPEILTDYYSKRKNAKKISLLAEKEMDDLKKIKQKRESGSAKALN
jgi:DNA polymerase elongation subunit (family B)